MIETISGIFAAIVIIVLTRVLDKYFKPELMATAILVAIGFIYVGFSLKDDQLVMIIVECTIAMALYFVALIGYTRNSKLIAFGIIFHGVWDIVHHNNWMVKDNVPGYWPSFCFVIDIIDGLYFYFLFKNQKVTRQSIETGR